MRPQPSLQWLLSVVAVLLALNLLVQLAAISEPRAAMAQSRSGAGPEREPPTVFPNTAEQFRRLNDAMAQTNDRLARIEAKLDKGISVKVTEMPAVEVRGGAKAE